MNNAAKIVYSVSELVPTLLLIQDADLFPLMWIPTPLPPGLRIVLLAPHTEARTRHFSEITGVDAASVANSRNSGVLLMHLRLPAIGIRSSCLVDALSCILQNIGESGQPVCIRDFVPVLAGTCHVSTQSIYALLSLLCRIPVPISLQHMVGVLNQENLLREDGVTEKQMPALVEILAPLVSYSNSDLVGTGSCWEDCREAIWTELSLYPEVQQGNNTVEVQQHLNLYSSGRLCDDAIIKYFDRPALRSDLVYQVDIVVPLLARHSDTANEIRSRLLQIDVLFYLYKSCDTAEILSLIHASGDLSEFWTGLETVYKEWQRSASWLDSKAMGLVIGNIASIGGAHALARRIFADGVSSLEPVRQRRVADWHLATVQLNSALNEIRYWDSRRDWSSRKDLEILMLSSTSAVDIFNHLIETTGHYAPGLQTLLSYALSAHANASFKMACIYEGAHAHRNSELANAAESVRMSIRLMADSANSSDTPPSLALGLAMLISGVISTVRAQGMMGAVALDLTLESLDSFYAAETTLQRGVARVCEISVFTHGNLAETYFYVLHEIDLGLFHFSKSWQIARIVFGEQHHCTLSKKGDLARALQQLNRFREADLLVRHNVIPDLHDSYEVGPYRFILEKRGCVSASKQLGCNTITPCCDMLAVD